MVGSRYRVLILGGGFGGIKTALALADDKRFAVALLTDNTNFRYYPQLYHAAVGGSSLAASIPLTEIFKDKPVNVFHDSAKRLDRRRKIVIGDSGHHYGFDVLVVALGVVTDYFGVDGLSQHAFGIKTLDEAKRFHNHLHQQLVEQGQADVNYVVVGGGPTGVELAGALPAYIRRILKNHGLKGSARVDLVEAESRVLPKMPKAYSRVVGARLRRLGVKLYLNQKVEGQSAQALITSSQTMPSQSVVWTAGVTNHPWLRANGFRLSQRGKIPVDDYLRADIGIYVIGDNADTPYSGMAQTALHDGRFVAANLKRLANGEEVAAYQPRKPVYVTPVGPGWAAVAWGKFQLSGRSGWWLRSLADLAAYHDLEPWWPASRRWLASIQSDETCKTCA